MINQCLISFCELDEQQPEAYKHLDMYFRL